MKPRNKFQERISMLSGKLSPVTAAQLKWGYKHCIDHIGQRTKKGVITCLECAHQWTGKTRAKYCKCPACNSKLEIKDTRQRVFNDYQYLCVLTTCEEFQVLRFVYIDYAARTGKKAMYYASEVVQLWIAPNGKYATLARLRPMGFFVHTWRFNTPLEIRPNKSLYNVTPTCTYPRQKLIPEIKRSGFTGDFYELTPFDMLHYILTENKAETLLKTKQIALLKFFINTNYRNISGYWASIRICIRNGYRVENPTGWTDYIDLLRFFGKDLHNAKYVCPDDLKTEHDRYVRKKQEVWERERREEAKRKALEQEAKFREMKAKFFGIEFTDGLIQVRVLESVQEIMTEGKVLHHCVFTNSYHLKPDSLILSAYMDGKKLETVEISLSKWRVLQSRGLCNENSEYHSRIIKLVNKNIPLIKKKTAA